MKNDYLYIWTALKEEKYKEAMKEIEKRLDLVEDILSEIVIETNPVLGEILSYYIILKKIPPPPKP